MKTIFALHLLGIVITSSLQAQAPDSSDEAVLQRMAQKYASLSTYADSGTVCDYHLGMRNTNITTFQIYFVRPASFRFAMTNDAPVPHGNLLWSDGNQTLSWMQLDPVLVTNVGIRDGIYGFTGISGRTVHNIPSLLQTNWASQEVLSRITSPKLLGDEAVNGTDCYHVSGAGKAGRRFEIWFGKADYLVRKILTTYPNFWSEEVHQDITVNQKIAPETFNFTVNGTPAKN